MKSYLISLLVITAVFTGVVFVTSAPFSKAGVPTNEACQAFCDQNVVCACAGKVIGNLRETSCKQGCPDPSVTSCETLCTCESKCLPPTKKGKVLEEPVQWLKFPPPVSTPFCDTNSTC
jgi:hypothetical protein